MKNKNEYTLTSWEYLIKKTLKEIRKATNIKELFSFNNLDKYVIEIILKIPNIAVKYLPTYDL